MVTHDYLNNNLIRRFILTFEKNFMGEIQSEFNYLIDDTYQIDDVNSTLHSSTSSDNEGLRPTSGQSQIKEGISSIIGGCFNGGSNGGDSDSDSPTAIPSISFWINGSIREVFDRIPQYLFNASTTLSPAYKYIGYVSNYIEAIPDWVHPLGLSIIFIYRFYRFLDKRKNFNYIDIIWSVPAYRNLQCTLENPDRRDPLHEWVYINPTGEILERWSPPFRNFYDKNRLINLMRSLGLVCINKLELASEFIHRAHNGIGIKITHP